MTRYLICSEISLNIEASMKEGRRDENCSWNFWAVSVMFFWKEERIRKIPRSFLLFIPTLARESRCKLDWYFLLATERRRRLKGNTSTVSVNSLCDTARISEFYMVTKLRGNLMEEIISLGGPFHILIDCLTKFCGASGGHNLKVDRWWKSAKHVDHLFTIHSICYLSLSADRGIDPCRLSIRVLSHAISLSSICGISSFFAN